MENSSNAAVFPGSVYDPGTKAPENRLESVLPDKKPLLNKAELFAESSRCLYCFDAPCIKSCPTGIDIPTFIRKISTENLAGSARVILDANILGLSCARVCPTEVLCEGDCVYNEMDQKPIMIGKLQRVATEYAYDRGLQFFERGESSGKKIAIIGGGPAGLACAHELSRLGHESVIFEARDLPGGLNSNGVAPYKLHLPDSLREISYILEIGGIELRTGVKVGQDISFADLEKEFDAVFIGAGLGPDSVLDVPGKDLDGVVGAVEWIEQLKTVENFSLSAKNVVILGGGNTAIDVVRECALLGADSVTMVYRRDQKAMSGYAHEWSYAQTEGARASWWSQPVAYEGEGSVTGVRCVKTQLGEAKKDGWRPLENVEGSDFVVPADLVILAVGQSKLETMLSEVEGLTFRRGRVVINEAGQTSRENYFAGGDAANGGKEVVNAAAEGKTAANGIDAYLRGL